MNPSSQDVNLRILESDNNFNVDDFSSSSDLENSDAYIPIMTLDYDGTWNSTFSNSNTSQFGFFNNTFGTIEFTASENYSQGIDDILTFRIYDGNYKNQKAAIINFQYDNDTDFNPSTSTFQNSSITFTMFESYEDSDFNSGTTCEGSYMLQFMDSATNAPYQKMSNDYQTVYALFSLNSTNCSISIYASVSTNNSIKASKALHYAFMLVGICVAHLIACLKISKDITQNENRGNKISLITLALFSGWDVFLCLFHLYSALTVDDFFPSFVIPSFCYFILVSIFETRLILLVWKARYYSELVLTNDLRRGLMIFYLKFYGFLTLFLLVSYFVVPAVWFFYATGCFFLPQIVHNTMRGHKSGFNKCYIFLLGLPRLALPLYVMVCPVSIFRLAPEISFAYAYGAIFVAQVLILFLQHKFGPRFFIPSCFLPAKYDYYRTLSVKTGLSEDEMESCSICMDGLNQSPTNVKTGLLNSSLLNISKSIRIMQTPCKHQFHETCLKDWMDIKLECPFCRTKLPPLE